MMSKYYKFFILFFTFFISFIFITPNVFADNEYNGYTGSVSPGFTWSETIVEVYRYGSSLITYQSLSQGTYLRRNVFMFGNATSTGLRLIRFYLFQPQMAFENNVAVFVINGLSLPNTTDTLKCRFGNGQQSPVFIDDIQLASDIDNHHVYYHTYTRSNYAYTLLFIPCECLVDTMNNHDGYINTDMDFNYFYLNTNDTSNNQLFLYTYASIQFLANIDLVSTNIVQYIDDIESSLLSIDQKLNAIISILNNQQSSSAATSQDNQTTTEHDQIDNIQNQTLTDIGTVSSDIINNNNFNLHDSSMLSGAAYITAIANNIFSSMGTFSWLLVFCGFLAIIDYILGRVGIV